MGTGVLSLGSRAESGRNVTLNAHLHLPPMLRMSGAPPLLPFCAFVVCTGQLQIIIFNTVNHYTQR